jgi:hypothetical protein
MRPATGISVMLVSAYVLLTQRRKFWKFLIGAAMVGLPWVVINVRLYGCVLPSYYLPSISSRAWLRPWYLPRRAC